MPSPLLVAPTEPVYILAKPELLEEPPVASPPSPMTPARSNVVELEISNPPGSHSTPRLSLRSTPRQPVAPSPVQQSIAVAKEATPKIESWTSQFLKAKSPGPATAAAEATRPIPEPAVPEPVIPEPAPRLEERRAPVPKTNPALAHLQAEAAPAVESPLTRARRIDSQNTWREQQLSKFFVSKTEVLKNAMDTLKVVKAEERSSKILVERRQTAMQAASETVAAEQVKAQEAEPVVPSPKKARTPVKARPDPPMTAFPKPSIPLSPLKGSEAGGYQDVFKVASPLKAKKDTLVFTSGPASPNFLGSFEAPPLDNTEIPDELAFPEVPRHQQQQKAVERAESMIPTKREPSMVPPGLSEEERIKRQRLKERQLQAIEKRNAQIRKAQEARQKVTSIIVYVFSSCSSRRKCLIRSRGLRCL